MTDAEWAAVRPLLPVPGWMRGRGGQPEAYCHRAILDAIGYLVDKGIKWRAMPADFPPWDRAYAFFRRWRDHGLVKEFHDRLRARIRERLGRDAEPSAGVIDSQSVKADAVVGSDSRGFDGGKLVNGRKRHVVVDTLGLLLGVMVTAADTGDRTAARVLLRQVADVHHQLELVWADGGYTGSLVEYCLARLALGPGDRSNAATTCAASWCCPSGGSSSVSSPTSCAPAAWCATTSVAPPAPRRWSTGRWPCS
ncbi:IS5 family transposase [Streptomyces sp. NPDC001401]|uniref:IS5 family transposase n=1 Tax=Streptomyces sp. NPDC001401 TaxID=3364570 RepID=UPI0036899318